MMRDSIHPGETPPEHLDALGTNAAELALIGSVVREDFGPGGSRNVDARDQARVAPASSLRYSRRRRPQPATGNDGPWESLL